MRIKFYQDKPIGNSMPITVGCILAGADIVLGPQNFIEAFEAVVKAVENGKITEERINQSVRRILKLKIEKGHK